MWAKHKQHGFTIVELLIVIVVIAVLAAISIVAYNGIQERAKVNQQISAFSQYSKAFMMYRAERGEYPYVPASNGLNACIYPTTNCFTPWDSATTTALRTNISTIITSEPHFNETTIITRNDNVSGTGYNGLYFFIRYPASLSICPSVNGLTVISRDSGNPTICRYAPPAA